MKIPSHEPNLPGQFFMSLGGQFTLSLEKQFHKNKNKAPLGMNHASGAKVFQINETCDVASQWGLMFLIDPAATAHHADVFWRERFNQNRLKMHSQINRKGDFNLSDLQCRKAVLLTPKRELLLLKEGVRSITLVSKGSSILSGRLAVTFECNGLTEMQKASENLAKFHQILYENSSKIKSNRCALTKRLGECLVALDESLAGRSYRNICVRLYGKQRTDEAWKSASRSLKDRVRRLVKRGRDLMIRDYISLLS